MNLALNVQPDHSTPPPTVDPPMEALIYHVALLAGMGPAARKIADELGGRLRTFQNDGRTCIDAGSSLMFSLLAPGPRSLRVMIRRGIGEDGNLPWLRAHFQPDRGLRYWHTLTYMGEPKAAWENARNAAERAGGLDHLRRTHAILGPYSRLYSISQTAGTTAPLAWVGWQLDRTLPIDKALAALRIEQAWPAVARFWEALLGSPPHPRYGPWSIGLRLGGEPRLRVGSTNWSRRIEDNDKRRRMVDLVENQGGDRRFAESLYKLISAAARPGRVHALGRAVELEFFEGRPELSEFYLCVP